MNVRPSIPGMALLAAVLHLNAAAAQHEQRDWWAVATTGAIDEQLVGSVTLSGVWLDTCAPDSIEHEILGSQIRVSVEHVDINVGCGDALTPWTLTEALGPLDSTVYSVWGSLYGVDVNREIREWRSGPDLLVASYVAPEPTGICLLVCGLVICACRLRVSKR